MLLPVRMFYEIFQNNRVNSSSDKNTRRHRIKKKKRYIRRAIYHKDLTKTYDQLFSILIAF